MTSVAADAASKQLPVVEPAQEFSSSEYSKHVGGIVAGEPPAIDLAAEKRLQGLLVALATDGSVQSAHDISDGGIAVAIAESCFASAGGRPEVKALAAKVSLDDSNAAEFALFGERGARAIVSVAPASLARVNAIAAQYKVGARRVGAVTRAELRIQYEGATVIQGSIESLRRVWSEALPRAIENA